MSKEKKHPHPKLTGTFGHSIFSPKGEIEGLMLVIEGEPSQVVVDPEAEVTPLIANLTTGQTVDLEAARRKPSPKGESQHAVYELHRLLAIDGRKATGGEIPSVFSGTVSRLNFAKHGEANGVVLDSGDFIHLKPEGMAASGLRVGDRVKATGEARRLRFGNGLVIEAHELNGKKVKHKPAHDR